jgi:hypothetical protein
VPDDLFLVRIDAEKAQAEFRMRWVDHFIARLGSGMEFSMSGMAKVDPRMSPANSTLVLPDPELDGVILNSAFWTFGSPFSTLAWPDWTLGSLRWSLGT